MPARDDAAAPSPALGSMLLARQTQARRVRVAPANQVRANPFRGSRISPAAGAIGSAGSAAGRPGRGRIYRLSWSPALAEIVGDGRPWTVLMISLLSMPCR